MNSQITEALPIKAHGGERLGPANCWTAPYDIPTDVSKKIIAARDALTHMSGTDAIQEAYHQLYAIADPEFKSINPWSILEAQSNDKLTYPAPAI